MDKTNKHKVMAAMVRAFFEAFTSGIVDCRTSDVKEKFSPQTIKRLMLNHYEQIAPAFHDIMFYHIACLNYKYDEIEKKIRQLADRKTDTTDMMKVACRTAVLHKSMVDEYKRNFEELLKGKYISVTDHLKNYSRPKAGTTSEVDTDLAIRAVVRTVMEAYTKGIKCGGTGKASLHQASIFRLMLDAMTVLIDNGQPSLSDAENGRGLNGMFMKACRTEHNFEVMTEEMDNTYRYLVDAEGIVSRDDTTN